MRCVVDSSNSKGPVIGNNLGIHELPKDSHVPIDVSPIMYIDTKQKTPPKNKSKYFNL